MNHQKVFVEYAIRIAFAYGITGLVPYFKLEDVTKMQETLIKGGKLPSNLKGSRMIIDRLTAICQDFRENLTDYINIFFEEGPYKE